MWVYLFAAALLIFVSYRLPLIIYILSGNTVKRKLLKLDEKKYTVIHNLQFKHKTGKSVRIDYAIISDFGFFVVNVHKYNGVIVGSEQNNYWMQHFFSDSKKIPNPLKSAMMQMKVIKEAVNDPTIPMIPIIVLGGFVSLRIKTSAHVIYCSQLMETIGQFKQTVINEHKKKNLIHSLKKHQNEFAVKTQIYNVGEILEERKKLVDANICPKCGSALIVREGKRGKYKGCSRYPKCKFKAGV